MDIYMFGVKKIEVAIDNGVDSPCCISLDVDHREGSAEFNLHLVNADVVAQFLQAFNKALEEAMKNG